MIAWQCKHWLRISVGENYWNAEKPKYWKQMRPFKVLNSIDAYLQGYWIKEGADWLQRDAVSEAKLYSRHQTGAQFSHWDNLFARPNNNKCPPKTSEIGHKFLSVLQTTQSLRNTDHCTVVALSFALKMSMFWNTGGPYISWFFIPKGRQGLRGS